MAAASSESQLLITAEETNFVKSPKSPITQHTRSSSSSRSRSPMQARRQARSRSPIESRSPMRSRRQTRSRSPIQSRRQSRSRSPFRPQQRFRSRSPTRFQRRSNYGTYSRDRRDRRRENPSPNRCLGIFGLSLHTKQGDLERIFSEYGIVEEVKIIHDRKTGNSKRFGFIYFKHIRDAIEARNRCSGMEIDQRNVRIDFSTTQRAHSPTPGIYKGNRNYREDCRRDDRRNYGASSYRSRSPRY